ncbi:MAG: hypothetical protein Q8S33_16335 [Myxococcales bacterium]|nr:hypothetical protein [Myxococcales bacterium]
MKKFGMAAPEVGPGTGAGSDARLTRESISTEAPNAMVKALPSSVDAWRASSETPLPPGPFDERSAATRRESRTNTNATAGEGDGVGPT